MSIQPHDISSEQRQGMARVPHGARGDPTVWCTCATSSTSSATGQPVVVLRVAGELDLGTVDILTAALSATLRQHPEYLIVDLAEVIFCGARGLAAIAEAGVTATRDGTRFGVSAASALMRRCWAQFWGTEQPTQFLTAAAAMNSNSEPPPLDRAIHNPRLGFFPPTFPLELDGWENEGGRLLTGLPEPEHSPASTTKATSTRV